MTCYTKKESTIVIFFLFLKQYGYIFLTSFDCSKEDILMDVFFSYSFMNFLSSCSPSTKRCWASRMSSLLCSSNSCFSSIVIGFSLIIFGFSSTIADFSSRVFTAVCIFSNCSLRLAVQSLNP